MGRRRNRKRRWGPAILALTFAWGSVSAFVEPAGAATGLSVVPSPSPPGPPRATLGGVSCPSATFCVVVGDGATGAIFVDEWNGAAWTTRPIALPAGATSGSLADIACASPTSCFAVGSFVPSGSFAAQTLVEQWNGSSWSPVASPNLPPQYASSLNAVTCVGTASCVAVGTDLIEQWDGTTWSMVVGPNPVTSVDNQLADVSCATATNCVAVGSVGFSSTYSGPPKTLIERWNGTSWSIVPSPNPAPKFGFGDALSSVACPSAATCITVGHFGSGVLVEQQHGTTWSVVATPKLAVGGSLQALTCASTTNCTAVGANQGGPTLVEHWDGTRWSIVASPQPGGFINSLHAVSCAGADSCLAVGTYETVSAITPFVQRWNGTSWSVVPLPTDASQSRLASVSCVSATNCFAVGSYLDSSATKTLIEHWNGVTWSIVASPNPSGASDSVLTGVSCPTATSCLAVGSYENATAAGTLAERWNGARWSIVPSPRAPTFSAVSCPTASTCFAVGSEVTQGADLLVEKWSGGRWSVIQRANPSGFNNYLTSVSCVSVTSCAAVGYVGSDLADQPVLEHWNGKKWSIVFGFATSTSTPAVRMTGVSCTSTTSCIAVGNRTTRWNGKTWSNISSSPSGGDVSCTSATSCVSAGGASAASWNGTSWSPIPSPNPDGQLVAISCVSSTECFAVGSYDTADSTKTLVEQTS